MFVVSRNPECKAEVMLASGRLGSPIVCSLQVFLGAIFDVFLGLHLEAQPQGSTPITTPGHSSGTSKGCLNCMSSIIDIIAGTSFPNLLSHLNLPKVY